MTSPNLPSYEPPYFPQESGPKLTFISEGMPLPDGAYLLLTEDENGDLYVREQEPDNPVSSNMCYPRHYVEQIGDGDFQLGAQRIGLKHVRGEPTQNDEF